MNAVSVEIRRGLQTLLAEERDLVNQAGRAAERGEYVRLRELADELIKVAERRASLRTALGEAQIRDRAEQAKGTGQRQNVDQAAETWRQLR